MDYELYHDESKVDGYWHGIYLVPVSTKSILLDLLNKIRNNTKYQDKIGFKKVKHSGYIFNCADGFIQVGVASLLNSFKNQNYPIDLKTRIKGKRQQENIDKLIKSKFILFRVLDDHRNMKLIPEHTSKIETTIRIGIKGGIHLLGNNEEHINIVKMHFDGYEHYNRHLNKQRIIDRIYGLRDYCSFSNDKDIIDDRHSNHKKNNSQTADDCNILQLVDLLIGCFRTILNSNSQIYQKNISLPVRRIIERYMEGSARMKNSRWKNGFCMSQCQIENGEWKYMNFKFEKNKNQESLFI